MKWTLNIVALLFLGGLGVEAKEYLIKLDSEQVTKTQFHVALSIVSFSKIEARDIKFNGWHVIDLDESSPLSHEALEVLIEEGVLQENFTYRYAFQLPKVSEDFLENLEQISSQGLDLSFRDFLQAPPDNPDFLKPSSQNRGRDPLFNKQWGMKNIGMDISMANEKGEEIVVAVIDTGVDYTHPDLVENLWVNKNEIPNNNIDDDENGYVDDIYGWDFVSNDNKPYDLKLPDYQIILLKGNPGHGTHCAGNVAARGNNKEGILGVAPYAKIMAIRFLGERGQGSSEGAVKSIRYAVDNGAKVLSNSWGAPASNWRQDPNADRALKEVIEYAESKGVLFIAAAGNGDKQGNGYSNEDQSRAVLPASYEYESIISVAALDINDGLSKFSNYGATTVDIGAPGVDVFSTVVTLAPVRYNNVVLDLSSLGGPKITWSGTSMATPHVAGAVALYWSQNPEAHWRQVKKAILESVVKINALSGKVTSNGKLNLKQLMRK